MRASEFVAEISDEQLQRYLDRAGRQVDARQERMARVRDRLNKGYEIYHAETPNRIVHRFEARTPQEAKRYYDDFITKYESDVDYDLRLRRATGIMESTSNTMSTEDMIAYLRQHHDTNLHQDYLDHVNTNSKFILKDIPLSSISLGLSGLDRAKVEKYKKQDTTKAPPIVVGSDGYILDGYHRATAVKELGIPTIRAYVGVKGVAEGYACKLDFDKIYGKYLKVTDNNGDPGKPGFSLVTPLNGDSWNWRERPEFIPLVKKKLNQPGWLGNHKYQQIIDSMSGKQFDPAKHIATEDTEDYAGMQIRVSKDSDGVAVRALAGGKELGMAEFFFDEQGRLDPQTVWVDERYHGQGIAAAMYDYLKDKGYTIVRSWDQTDAGRGFWDKHRGEKATVWEDSLEKSPTFDMPRRSLNVPELIKRGAIFITHPHGANGWELNQPTWDFSLITLENVLKKSPPWSAEAPKYIRPESYQEAIKSKLWDGLGDEKYKQILWSIKKLGIPEKVAFLDTVSENFADGKVKGKSRPGRVKRAGASCNGSVTDLRRKAKNSSGEKAKMYHWCANMKSGREKKNK